MATHADLAAHLLRAAAHLCRGIARDNADLHDEMIDNAMVYEMVACLVETDPTGKANGEME